MPTGLSALRLASALLSPPAASFAPARGGPLGQSPLRRACASTTAPRLRSVAARPPRGGHLGPEDGPSAPPSGAGSLPYPGRGLAAGPAPLFGWPSAPVRGGAGAASFRLRGPAAVPARPALRGPPRRPRGRSGPDDPPGGGHSGRIRTPEPNPESRAASRPAPPRPTAFHPPAKIVCGPSAEPTGPQGPAWVWKAPYGQPAVRIDPRASTPPRLPSRCPSRQIRPI